tara:strand:+ start:835 stop:1110 length:276 start_codon:yes stop_codon:yes gene_type:complete
MSFPKAELSSREWLIAIDASSFGPEEWEEAASHLLGELNLGKLQATFPEIREYLSCCAEAAIGSYPLPSFVEIVKEFYDQYGFDSAKPLDN